jgi:hypothetical protein
VPYTRSQAVLAGYSVGELAIFERFVGQIRAVFVGEAAKAASSLGGRGSR